MLSKILKWWILGLIFLLPLFWLPFTFEFIEFNKLYLLFFGSWLGIFLWNLKMIFVDKGIKIRWSKFDWLIFGFFLLIIFSFIFSQDRFTSLFGGYGRFNNGLIAFLSFFGLYILIRNNIEIEQKEEKSGVLNFNQIFWALFISSFLAVLWIWGWLIFSSKFSQFFVRAKLVFSPLGNTAFSTSLYLALMTILVLARLLLLQEKEKGKIVKGIFMGIFLILSLALLVIFDFAWSWVVLGLGLIGFLFLSLKLKIFRENIHKLSLPIFLVLLSGLFLLLEFRVLVSGLGIERSFLFNYPTEAVLWQSESWNVAIKTATANFKNAILGSGVGTFLFDYAKFKSDKILKSNLFSIRFGASGNNISEILATGGFLSFILLILAIIFLLINLWKAKILEWQKLLFGSFLFTNIVLQFVFYQNMVLGGIFWLVLGIGASFAFEKEKRYQFREHPEIGLISETITLLLLILFGGGFFFGIKFYLADVNYAKAFSQTNPLIQIENTKKATILNQYQLRYQLDLASLLIQSLKNEVLKPKEEQNQQNIQAWTNDLVVLLNNSIPNLSKNNVLGHQALGSLWQDLIGIAQGSPENKAIEEYTKAIELEPKNPALFTQRGKIYFSKVDFEKAKEDFEKAIAITPYYIDAQIQMTFIEETEGKIDQAISRLESLANDPRVGLNLDLLVRLGWLYHNNKEYDKAINVLEGVTRIYPFHANALFILGLSYEKEGKIDEAIQAFERLAQIDPTNRTVQEELKKLKGQ